MSTKKAKKATAPAPETAPSKNQGGKKPIVKNGNAGISKSDDRPSEKSSIFGDWTGKTPVSLLHEHCQKQGWEKPVFDIARNKHGFLGSVRLGRRNKKTTQIQTVTLMPPSDNASFCAPTAVEARHIAATFALHRVNSHMPLHRVLPPQHREYWRQFEQLKTNANAWQYVPDPFTATPPAAASSRAARSAAATSDKLPSKDHASAAVPMPPSNPSEGQPRNGQLQKEWEHLPVVHMNANLRARVEDVIKKESLVYQPSKRELSPEAREEIRQTLARMGFRPAHVEEALEYCSDTAEALDWLCLHVPEDDLPSHFMLAKYDPTMTTISHTTQSLSRDWMLKRMSAIGYSESICKEAMQITADDDLKALALLQWRLVHDEEPMADQNVDTLDKEELVALREEEAMTLESIYGPRLEHDQSENDRTHFRIHMTARLSATSRNRSPLVLDIILPNNGSYPHVTPIFAIVCDGLPSYLKLAMLRGIVEEAEKNLNGPHVYMCAEWLQENVDRLIENPPKLRDVTEKMMTLTIQPPMPKSSQKLPSRRRSGWPEGNNQQLKLELVEMRASEQYATLGRVRSRLPANAFKSKVVEAVLNNQVAIISGETGCGKTTQVPQFILDEEIMQDRGAKCSIICTQPRKISALGVAERVAAERCEKVGKTVGYAIRGETKTCAQTRLQFCTTGVLLRRLHSDPSLEGISHVLIDEVHERSVDSDFLLIILKDVMKQRKDLKVVLMSATINQQLFSTYFGGAPSIEIPGFTHPVEDFYLEDILKMTAFESKMPIPKENKDSKGEWAATAQEYLDQGYDEQVVRTLARYRKQDKIDYDLVTRTVAHIIEHDTVEIEGGALSAILIFMPGAMEIRRCVESLQQALESPKTYEILPLHANLSPQEQARVFRPVGKGVRKVVVATNVAETSITIEGVVYVVDVGRVKETQYVAENNMVHLVETWASRASCKQRRGRAGRTRPGQCFKLFTRKIEANKMRPQQVPELLRTPLEQLCLQVKSMGKENVKAFLQRAIDPPSVAALDSAIRTLQAVDAIDSTERGELTPLGKHMATIPADLRISKMLLFGCIFRCLDPVLTVAATMSLKSPFTSPMDKREEAREARERFLHSKSDWLTDMRAFEAWHDTLKEKGMREARKFCEANFLSFNTLSEIQSLKRQYKEALEETGFVARSQGKLDPYNENAANTNLVKAVVFSGLNPNLARIRIPDSKYDKVLSGTVEREKEARDIKFYTQHDGRVFLHPASILFGNNQYNPSSFLTYFSCMTTTKTFLRDGTEVSAYAVLFFGGQVNVDHLRRGLQVGVDGWIKLRAWARIGVLVNQLKRLLQASLREKIETPSLDVSASPVVQVMMALIATDGI